MLFGIKISKPTKKVSTAPISDLSMTSESNSLKIAQEGPWSLAVTPPGTPYTQNYFTKTIPHNLGYPPTFRVQGCSMFSPTYFRPYPYLDNSGVGNTIETYVDSTNLYIRATIGSSVPAGDLIGYYYIFKDRL